MSEQPPMVRIVDRLSRYKMLGFEVAEMAESGAHDGDTVTLTLTLRRPARERVAHG